MVGPARTINAPVHLDNRNGLLHLRVAPKRQPLAPMPSPIEKLLATMAALRHPDNGCPWDLRQDHRSLIPYLLEETYEVIDAIDNGNDNELREELGDLLFQIVFHARIAAEQQRFDFDDITTAIDDKLVRRHPHVFGNTRIDSDAELEAAWAASKQAEKPAADRQSLLDGVPRALPALMRAQKLQRRAARAGFDWPDHHGPLEKIHEETAEIEAELARPDRDEQRLRDEVGDLLFSVVNLARHLGIDAEDALRSANEKFTRRFQAIEQSLQEKGVKIDEAGLDELEAQWQAAKQVD